MVKHGTSHGISVLFCTIIAAFLAETLKPFLPKAYAWVDRASIWMLYQFQIPVTAEQLSITLVASVLAILWGIFFKLRLSDH